MHMSLFKFSLRVVWKSRIHKDWRSPRILVKTMMTQYIIWHTLLGVSNKNRVWQSTCLLGIIPHSYSILFQMLGVTLICHQTYSSPSPGTMSVASSLFSSISGYIPTAVKEAAGLSPQISEAVRHLGCNGNDARHYSIQTESSLHVGPICLYRLWIDWTGIEWYR